MTFLVVERRTDPETLETCDRRVTLDPVTATEALRLTRALNAGNPEPQVEYCAIPSTGYPWRRHAVL